MKNFDVHGINRRMELAINNIQKSSILKENKDLIMEFIDYCLAESFGKHRITKYVNVLHQLGKWLSIPFTKAKKEDIIRLVRHIEKQDYSEWTKHDYKVILKRFFKWLNGDGEYPEEVKWIKTTMRKINTKIPEELLTPKDIEKLINAANHPRDKALIAVLYESGCRIGELLTLRIKHVSFDEYGAKIVVNGKTGMRRIRIVSSVPYLATWIANHPLRNDPDAPLWVGIGTRNKNGAIKYRNIRKLIRELAKRAGIKKRVNPHIFRHSRATHLANHLTEAQMNQYFGWVQGSDMPSIYVHLSGRDVDGAILNLYGLKEENENKKDEFAPIKCSRCGVMNPPGEKFCIRCGMPLNIKAALEVENERKRKNLMSILMKDPEVRSLIARKIREMRLNYLLK